MTVAPIIQTIRQLDINAAGTSGVADKRMKAKLDEIVSAINAHSLALGSATGPFHFAGSISVAADFPLLTAVQDGDVYKVLADVTDNGGVTRTNTGLSFLAGTEIAWGSSTWTALGTTATVQVSAVTPVVLPAGSSVTFVDTATIGAAIAATLPAVTAKDVGITIGIGDYTGDCIAHNITVTPAGTDTIDGVNAAFVLNKNYAFVELQCVAAGKWKTTRFVLATSQMLTDKGTIDAALVDGDFTADGRLVRTSAGVYTTILDSLANTIAPTANNDASGGAGGKQMGFSVGSLWIDTTADKAYLCLDSTNTAAVWVEVDITAASVDAAGAVMEGDYAAFSILAADTVDVPLPLTLGPSTIPARLAAGGIVAASVAQIQALLGVDVIVDDHVHSDHVALVISSGGAVNEVSAALNGAAGKKFTPDTLLLQLTAFGAAPGALAGDAEVSVGTTPGGTEIKAAGLIGASLDATGKQLRIALAPSLALDIAGDATLYVKITKLDTTLTLGTLKARVAGRQF